MSVPNDSPRFKFTDADIEKGAAAILTAHETDLDDLNLAERTAALANVQSDVQAVLEAIGGEWRPE